MRPWILQEVAPSRKMLIISGSPFVTFLDTPLVQALLRAHDCTSTHAAILNTLVVGFGSRISAFESLSTAGQNTIVTTELLRHARWSRTTGAKDKVFALYGLLEAYGLSLPQPDSLMSLGRIFEQITRALIEYIRKVDLVHQVHGMIETEDLPSWASAWSLRSYPQQASIPIRALPGFEDQSWSFQNNRKHLSVHGTVLDRVTTRANIIMSYTPM